MGDIFSKQNKSATERGVTLVELLTVVAIIGIIAGIPLVNMVQQRRGATLEEGQATVLHALNTTRSRAIAGVGGTGVPSHVACVRDDEVELFTADACPGDCSTCSGGDRYPLPPGVTAEEARISFSRISGASAEAVVNVSGFGNTRTVTVSDHGFIE